MRANLFLGGAVLLATLTLPLGVFGQQNGDCAQWHYETNNGAISIIAYAGHDGLVKLPVKINELPVIDIRNGAFALCTNLNLLMPASVTNSAFRPFDAQAGKSTNASTQLFPRFFRLSIYNSTVPISSNCPKANVVAVANRLVLLRGLNWGDPVEVRWHGDDEQLPEGFVWTEGPRHCYCYTVKHATQESELVLGINHMVAVYTNGEARIGDLVF